MGEVHIIKYSFIDKMGKVIVEIKYDKMNSWHN